MFQFISTSNRWSSYLCLLLGLGSLIKLSYQFSASAENATIVLPSFDVVAAAENFTHDPLEGEESQKNYMKQYPQPPVGTKPSRYHEFSIPFEENLLAHLAQKAGVHHPQSGEAHGKPMKSGHEQHGHGHGNQGHPEEPEEDSHYNPSYKDDPTKSTKSSNYGPRVYYSGSTKGGEEADHHVEQEATQHSPNAGPNRYHYKPQGTHGESHQPEIESYRQPTARGYHVKHYEKKENEQHDPHRYGKSHHQEESNCVCECPGGVSAEEESYGGVHRGSSHGSEHGNHNGGNHMVHRRSFHGREEEHSLPVHHENQIEPEDGEGHHSEGAAVSCHFARTNCGFENDKYDDSLFRYGYNHHFESKLWFIENNQLLAKVMGHGQHGGKHDEKRHPNHQYTHAKGWGRLMSPHYNVPYSNSNHDACILIEFEFDSEGTDHLTVMVQEEEASRTILDYMHERPTEKESLLLRKFVHFVVTGRSIRFFVQFQFDTSDPESQYGLRTFELFFGKCPHKDALHRAAIQQQQEQHNEKAAMYGQVYYPLN